MRKSGEFSLVLGWDSLMHDYLGICEEHSDPNGLLPEEL